MLLFTTATPEEQASQVARWSFPFTVLFPARCECGAIFEAEITLTGPVEADYFGSDAERKRECSECGRDTRTRLVVRPC